MPQSKLASLTFLAVFFTYAAFGQADRRITIAADLTDAPRKLLHAELCFPVHPGPLKLFYPKWIPGEHAPSGPIDNLAGLKFTADGRTLPWRRDDVDMYQIAIDIPAGTTKLLAKVDFLATATPSGFSAGASTSANLAVLNWNELVLYPAGAPAAEVMFEPSVTLPSGWKFGTALTPSSSDNTTTHFHAVPLNMLIDSPLLAGRFFKELPLAPEITPKHYLDIAADDSEDLNIKDQQLEKLSDMVRETGALFGSRPYNSYHFLLTLSDQVAHFGLEHHQSSDDRLDARTLIDEDLNMLSASLLPHEFTHSWNGKFRRPAGLLTDDYQHPMKSDLLWVYEGLTQYLGDVLAARSGLWDGEQYRSYLAASAAAQDHRPGRTWRNLQDTATAAQTLYATTGAWDNLRRSTDFYEEGELLWLDVDTTIRKLSKGKKSLNDFCARFLGLEGSARLEVVPYTFEDIVANLSAIQAADWASFLRDRLDATGSRAPLDGLANGGYRLEYTDQVNDSLRASEGKDHGIVAWYSLGLNTADGVVTDVLVASPAYKAGLGPGMKVVAVNGRRSSEDVLRQAIRDSAHSAEPVELLVDNDGYFKLVKLDYHGGEKYPHLVRSADKHAYLDEIITPMVAHAARANLR